MTPEQTLLRRARAFELTALAEIYDAYSGVIFRYAMRLVNDAPTAEDCVTETFSRLLGALKADIGPRDYLRAYLFRVAHNWIMDQWRAEASAPYVNVSLDEIEDDLSASFASHTAHEPEPMLLAFERIDAQQVRSALRSLTPDQRQVIALKFYEDLTNEETAHAIGKPVSAVKSLQHRALSSLKRMLVDKVGHHEPTPLKTNLREALG